jgi:TPR repeat protein
MALTDADIAEAKRIARASDASEVLYRLGLKFSSGVKAPVDLVEAHKWFNLAAMRGHDGAKAYRRECADMMTKAEVAAAQKAAREWLAIASDEGPAPPPAPVIKPQAAIKPATPAPAITTTQARPPAPSTSRLTRMARYAGSTPVFAA